ncbi:MAG: glycosyltransferase, partial [Actinomycetota bacterium]
SRAMRIGVDYQILALGPGLITRGMARYTQQQLRAVLAAEEGNEYVLLCDAAADLSLIDGAVRDHERVDLALYSPPAGNAADPGALLARAEHYQSWIARLDLDAYHATAPLMMEGPALVHFDACPMVSTFYDLIPFRFPEQYLTPPGTAERYHRTLRMLWRDGRLLAISDTARDDAVRLLGAPRERIDRAWPVPDEVFRPLPAHQLGKLLTVLASRVRIPERFVLTVSHLHHSKNLGTLLAGYAELPATLRTVLPLVVCCHLDPPGVAALRARASRLGIGDDVVITGHVSDLELAALYNQATLVVHPSRLEGFGYPVAEAMACGTAVVTTTAPALPEVAGDAAVLVDPEDPAAFAGAIATLARNHSARQELIERGFAQVAQFNTAQLATATLDSYRAAVAHPPAPPAGPRIALWTPLPPAMSGIADYSAELLGALEPRCDVEVFVDGGYLPPEPLLRDHTIHHFSAFDRRDAQQRFDAVVYQIGASPLHRYMAEPMRRRPGIAVLHDLLWSNVVYSGSVQPDGRAPAFEAALVELYGKEALTVMESYDFGDHVRLWDFFARYPMLDTVVAPSLAQIVHVNLAAEHLRASYPGCDPYVVQMGVADPFAQPGVPDPYATRKDLGIDPSRFIVGIFGIVHPAKRVEACVRAVGQIVAEGLDAVLLIAGPVYDSDYTGELMGLARRLGIAGNIVMTHRLSPEAFAAHLITVDVVVNLRTRMHHHMSAVVLRAIAAARPIVISDLPEWDFPPAFCSRVPTEGEVPALA